MKRYFSKKNFKRIEKDFNFLVKLISNSHGEYDFAIRKDYFNLYYKGNNMARVAPKKNDTYEVSINQKFFDGTKADNPLYYSSKTYKINKKTIYAKTTLSSKQLHPFFQKKHLKAFESRIKKVNNGEEITFEQSLITDNLDREDFIIIDRQVTDTQLKRKRMDLLALKQIEENKYHFIVLEVKLGNNPELKEEVASQLNFYVNHINTNFNSYKKCYEMHFKQKKELGLIKNPDFEEIEITEPVEGKILVGLYSGIAKKQIDELLKTYPDLNVKLFTNEI